MAISGVGERHGARCLGMYLKKKKKREVCASEWALHKPTMHVGMASMMRAGADMCIDRFKGDGWAP